MVDHPHPADRSVPATITTVRGILSAGGYVPAGRLERAQVSALFGSGGGRGTRAVASYDEDTTTMGVEAARLALRSGPATPTPEVLWFCTTVPAYVDKTNAAAVHAALRLPATTAAYDFGGALRSASGAVAAALGGTGTIAVVAADRRDGLPTSGDESAGGDAAAALVVGDDGPGTPVIAEYLGSAATTGELVERWRAPGERTAKLWEERFGENRYVAMGRDAWSRALVTAGVEAGDVDRLVVAGMHARATRSLSGRLGVPDGALVDDLGGSVGQAGAAHPALLLTAALEECAASTADDGPGRLVALVHLADGVDVTLWRTTPAIAGWRPARPVTAQVAQGSPVGYGRYLSWRGMVTLEPPRRPEPARVSSSAAWRSEGWKFGLTGSRDRASGAVHLPPARVAMNGGAVDDMEPVAMADRRGTVVTFTVDRMVFSPSPPVVFAVVDFDGGGRLPVELTDVDADRVAIGDRVEMTFRRLFTADGIHDYFWKARPVRGEPSGPAPSGATGSRDMDRMAESERSA
jgi:3-hydroxy-3-methylglutaryl CoA synthase/uncharacterized OB-fold protein